MKTEDKSLIDLAADVVALGKTIAATEAHHRLQCDQAREDVAAGKPVRWCGLCAKDQRPCWWHETRAQYLARQTLEDAFRDDRRVA